MSKFRFPLDEFAKLLEMLDIGVLVEHTYTTTAYDLEGTLNHEQKKINLVVKAECFIKNNFQKLKTGGYVIGESADDRYQLSNHLGQVLHFWFSERSWRKMPLTVKQVTRLADRFQALKA